MKRNIKFFIILALVLLFSSLSVLPASAASECVSPDPSYRTCDCGDGGSWNGAEYSYAGDGYIVYEDICNECNGSYSYTEWDSHAYSEQIIDGQTYNVCANCGDSYLIADTENPDETEDPDASTHTHVYKTTVVPPNCEERGYTWYECTYCGDAYQGDWTEITDHSYIFSHETKPTCTRSGYKYYVCEHCGLSASGDAGYIEPLGHDWSVVSSVVGENQIVIVTSECSRCGSLKMDETITAAAQAQNWLLTAIRGTTEALVDMYEILANGIEVGGVTAGEVITGTLILLCFVIFGTVLVSLRKK